MQPFNREKFREGVGTVCKGIMLAVFVLPIVLPFMFSLEQYLLENLPEVSVEGTRMIPRKEETPTEVEEIDVSQFVSIYQEELLMVKEEMKKTERVLEAVMYLEGGPKEQCQILVGEVVRNRTNDPRFPDEPIEVCEQEHQFEVLQNGVPVDKGGNPIDLDTVPEMEGVYEKVFVEESNETEKLLQAEALRQGLSSEKYWKGGALYFSNLDAVTEEVYAKGRYDEIKVSVKVGGNTYWRYWG